MSEVGVEIVKTEETEKNGIKYLNINVSNSEVERNPDIVRLCADAGILEYVKPKTGHWIKSKDGYMRCDKCGSRGSAIKARFCHHCGARMESEDKE
jgi:DNA-directed RNA polymerase subunit RPC12/RpoP